MFRSHSPLTFFTDWIAHGILDSIVDSFFPFLEEVEREVAALEDIVFSTGHDTDTEKRTNTSKHDVTLNARRTQTKIYRHDAEKVNPTFHEKHKGTKPIFSPKAQVAAFLHPIISRISRLVHVIGRFFGAYGPNYLDYPTPPGDTTSTLRRMARTRRLVTSLSRLLATKSEVVLQIRKRLLDANERGWGNETEKTDDVEVAIYMGDIQGLFRGLYHWT